MKTKALLCAATLAATLGLATDAMAQVGSLLGTTYGLSGRNYGSDGMGGYNFGVDLLLESEYTISDGGFTGDAQLGPGGGTPVTMHFGTPEMVNELEVSELYEVWDPGTNGVPVAHNDGLGVPAASSVPVPYWENTSHLFQIKIRDTAGTVTGGGGINRNVFESAVLRADGLSPNSDTPDGANDAIPLFPADRKPEQLLGGFDGSATGMYFYYEKNGVPANPAADINLPVGILQGDHFDNAIGAAQQVFYIVYSDGQLDDSVTHDIDTGSFGFNSDTERELQAGANLITLGDILSFANAFDDYDTIVLGGIYQMIAPGDGNSDGKVDGLDYLRWAANYGTTPTNDPLVQFDGTFAPIEEAPSPDGRLDFKRYYGDYNNDGMVDGLDYLKWAGNYGFDGTGAPQLASAVPEPASILLAFAALAGLGLVRRRR